MKKTFFAAFMLLAAVLMPRSASAEMQVFMTASTGTYCTVTVSTSVATRVDNFNGGCEGLMQGRTEIKIINQTGNAVINCGYSNLVSTPTANVSYSRLGEEFTAGAKGDLSIGSGVQYWCLSQAASAGQNVSVHQVKPRTTP